MSTFQQNATHRMEMCATRPNAGPRTLDAGLAELGGRLDSYAERFEVLLKRLDPVLQPEFKGDGCMPEAAVLKAANPDCPVVEQVDAFAARIGRMEGNLADLLARLAL